MAYDEDLAERLRHLFAARTEVIEKKMFGGVAFMMRGHMCVGILQDALRPASARRGTTPLCASHTHARWISLGAP